MSRFLLNINNKVKQVVLALIDMVLVVCALYFALLLRFEGQVPAAYLAAAGSLIIPVLLLNFLVSLLVGLYRRLWRYASINDLLLVTLVASLTAAGTFFYSWHFDVMLPRSVYIMFLVLLLFLLGASRLSLRLLASYFRGNTGKNGGGRKALIIGAGDAGVLVAEEIKKRQGLMDIKPVAFIDDDPNKQGVSIQGIPVLGGREKIPKLVREKKIEEVIIAMPSAAYTEIRQIIGVCEGLEMKIKTIPGIFEILEGHVGISRLKKVEIEDLLKRPPVSVDFGEISKYLTDKVVLVTGAGGSIGSELCRQISLMSPSKLVLLDNDENGIFYIHQEIEEKYPDMEVFPLLRDIQNKDSLEKAFREHRPQVVFHAAAYKHVPLMEMNVQEAMENNILGGKNLMDISTRYEAEHFILISSDKAVNPSSVMGVTKRVSEIYLQHKSLSNENCIFCAVRFGNVLGGRGSVVNLFREQIARGGPLTVTHPGMTRYFMTIPEAVQLVVQAGAPGKRGEIFVLDMGEPIRIMDLAKDMIILSGLQPGTDIQITISGIRPGEKLNEELFQHREILTHTEHQQIFVAQDTKNTPLEFEKELRELENMLQTDLGELLEFKDYARNTKT